MSWNILEKIIVGVLVAASAVYLLARAFRRKPGHSGCSECPSQESCREATSGKATGQRFSDCASYKKTPSNSGR